MPSPAHHFLFSFVITKHQLLSKIMRDSWQQNHCQEANTFSASQCFRLIFSFKNGSLTRERIRDTCAEGSWKLFNELLNSTPRGNFGNMGKIRKFDVLFLMSIRSISCVPGMQYIRIKLIPCLIKHRNIQVCGEVEV